MSCCRSLGLTLLECATGRYPYDASGGPLQLMIQARPRLRGCLPGGRAGAHRQTRHANPSLDHLIRLEMSEAQVVDEAVPLPAPGACSEEFRDFVRQCMQKDPLQRPSAEGLLSHPFILTVSSNAHALHPGESSIALQTF